MNIFYSRPSANVCQWIFCRKVVDGIAQQIVGNCHEIRGRKEGSKIEGDYQSEKPQWTIVIELWGMAELIYYLKLTKY